MSVLCSSQEWSFTLLSCSSSTSACSNYGTIMRTRITCKKIFHYMRKLACQWLVVEKYVKIRLNIFEFSYVKEIVKSWLVYENKFSWIIQSSFLTEAIKRSLCQLLYLGLFWEKKKFYDRARPHDTRSELKPVANLKPLWKVVPFTWQFHCGNFPDYSKILMHLRKW